MTPIANSDDLIGRHTAVHVVLSIRKGAAQDIEKFHKLLFWIDPDWPFVGRPEEYRKRRVCKVCRGRCYERPRLVPEDIKAAARQCGIKVKIKQYRCGTKCFTDGVEEYTYDGCGAW